MFWRGGDRIYRPYPHAVVYTRGLEYLGCAQKSVEIRSRGLSLYANGGLQEHIIGGFLHNLAKEKSLSNSWHQPRENSVL